MKAVCCVCGRVHINHYGRRNVERGVSCCSSKCVSILNGGKRDLSKRRDTACYNKIKNFADIRRELFGVSD